MQGIDLVFVHLCEFRRLIGCDAGINNLLDITIHDLIQLIQSQIDTMVGHAALWEVVGTDLLGTVSGTDLASSGLCLCVVGFLTLNVVKFRS